MGLLILLRTLTDFVVFIILFQIFRYLLFDMFIKPLMSATGPVPDEQFWKYIFYVFVLYNLGMILVINFINQVNKKYGPGVLLPLLMGRYRNPKEEEKIFMFMDLKSSTTIAEKLGHLKYSSFIRDSFMDINTILNNYSAQVYQYVGDEIVLTWDVESGLEKNNCLQLFYASVDRFAERSEYYNSAYGLTPEFKAGMHIGKITIVEIGEIKRDLAYHGDTVNTTARIQSICNDHNRNLLLSKVLYDSLETDNRFKPEFLGSIPLKGKIEPVEIVGIRKE